MVEIDFDFARYIAGRRNAKEQRAREGSAYAFAGERKFRRGIGSVRPVTMAIEATTRLWRNVAKNELLGTSIQVTDQQFPNVYAATKQAAATLRIDPPAVYIAPRTSNVRAQALGTNEDAYVVINAELLEHLSEPELLALVGNELGNVQNNHVLLATALFYLTHSAMSFVRWIVQPAIMTLQAWSRRAEITCDRAALLCTRDLEVTLTAIVKVALGLEGDSSVNIEQYLRELPDTKRGVGRFAELFHSHPYLPKRVQALRLFAESALYKRHIGEPAEGAPSAEDLDNQVADLVSVF